MSNLALVYFFEDLGGLTEVLGRMSAGISGQKLPLLVEGVLNGTLKSATAPKKVLSNPPEGSIEPLKGSLEPPFGPQKGSIEKTCERDFQNHRQGSVKPFASRLPFLGCPFKSLPILGWSFAPERRFPTPTPSRTGQSPDPTISSLGSLIYPDSMPLRPALGLWRRPGDLLSLRHWILTHWAPTLSGCSGSPATHYWTWGTSTIRPQIITIKTIFWNNPVRQPEKLQELIIWRNFSGPVIVSLPDLIDYLINCYLIWAFYLIDQNKKEHPTLTRGREGGGGT